ncbi:uncharacterized protein LOC105631731, partial [Jatropha curcas]|uniref:uncharacterized protein LOC105631731 n=1 Tax=Jatropha curcas TaxID=180498 RepID=UPI00189316C0
MLIFQDDILIWHWKDSGIYSVKSRYVEREDAWQSGFWKALRSLKVPSKVRHFLWRCCRDILPVKATLKRRGLELDTRYDYCGAAEICWNILHKVWKNEFFESYIMGLWSVWLSRNELKENQVEERPYHVVTQARSMLASWKKAQLKSSRSDIGVSA